MSKQPRRTYCKHSSRPCPTVIQVSRTPQHWKFTQHLRTTRQPHGGWSGGAKVLGKLPMPGRPTIWITVGQGPNALALGAGEGGLDIFSFIFPFFPLSSSLWGKAR